MCSGFWVRVVLGLGLWDSSFRFRAYEGCRAFGLGIRFRSVFRDEGLRFRV